MWMSLIGGHEVLQKNESTPFNEVGLTQILPELQLRPQFTESVPRSIAARLTLLSNCRKCLSRISRKRISILTAAKILAVSRLLIKSIDQGDDVPPLLHSMKIHLSSQRRRLLARIDVVLGNRESSLQQLVEAISAFCLATSSSSSDAIRHFHHLRLEEIKRLSEASAQDREKVFGSFECYLQSLRTIQQLLGHQLSDALRNLRRQPILRSDDLHSLEDLNLSGMQHFIPAEILNFVPWIKHEPPSREQTTEVLEEWSRVAFENVCQGLKSAINAVSHLSELLDFRARIYNTWLPICSSTPSHSADEIFNDLRAIFNARLKDILLQEAKSLSSVASDITWALKSDDQHPLVPSSSRWDHAFVTLPIEKGAATFKKQLKDRHLGHTKTTNSILDSLQIWTRSISTSLKSIQRIRKTRWIDVIEEDEQDDDRASRIEKILQKEDPDLYEQEHKLALNAAVRDSQDRIKEVVETISETETTKAIFLLRTVRGVYRHLQGTFPEQDLTTLSSSIEPLHSILASNTVSTLFTSIKPPSANSERKRIKAQTRLWEGDPPLPTHPSPRIFKLLQRLTAAMSEVGVDVWSSDAVSKVKMEVRKELVDRHFFGALSSSSVNGTSRGDGDESEKLINGQESDASFSSGGGGGGGGGEGQTAETRIAIQTLFDLIYLDSALGVPERSSPAPHQESDQEGHTASRAFEDLVQTYTRHASLDPAARKTLETRAREYWGRTSLLFGLLV
jgi:conserved oligomeric Golgi complex subunit 1